MTLHVKKRLISAVLLSLVAAPALLCASDTRTDPYTIVTVASTVPPNGDLNPYGVAVVPRTTGLLVEGDILVSNFNNSQNWQGTGTTIVEISPGGQSSVFAQIDPTSLPGPCPGGVGLTTALAVLQTGWVIVGSLPTSDGTSATAQAGCLLVLNNQGTVVETITDILINGPWDMTALDLDKNVALFVTNVLNGTVAANGNIVHLGTVVRINLGVGPNVMPHVKAITMIGSGFGERTDPAALVIGPTGVALAAGGTLYVADTLANRIMGIANAVDRNSSAGVGTVLSNAAPLNAPLGLTVVPHDGMIVTLNGNNGLLIALSPKGNLVSKGFLDKTGNPPGAGTLFGLAPSSAGLYFVDDGSNTLNVLTNPL